jgi:transposase
MVESTVQDKSWKEIEQTYKNLQYVERAFDAVKNLIEIRPVFHYKDTRVKWHILMCFFSYFLLFQFKKLCKIELESYTLDKLLTELRSVTKSYFEIQKLSISKVVECTDLQKKILNSCWISL